MAKPIDVAKGRTNTPEIQDGCLFCVYEYKGVANRLLSITTNFACSFDTSIKGASYCTQEDYEVCPLNKD